MKLYQQRSIFRHLPRNQSEKVYVKNENFSNKKNIYEFSYKTTARNQDLVSENVQDTIDLDQTTDRDAVKVFENNQSNFQTENIEESFNSSS